MFIRASTNPSGRRSEVQLPCKGCPLPTQEISPSKPDPYGNGTRKANRYSWYPIPRRGQLESLDSGSGTRLHHQLWHLVYFRDLCDFQRRKSQRSVPLSRNNLMSRIQHTDSSFTDNTFTLTSSRGKCSFEQDILTCGAHIDNPMEFEVSSVFFPSHLSAYSYKNRWSTENSPITETRRSMRINHPRAIHRVMSSLPRENIQLSWRSPGGSASDSIALGLLMACGE